MTHLLRTMTFSGRLFGLQFFLEKLTWSILTLLECISVLQATMFDDAGDGFNFLR